MSDYSFDGRTFVIKNYLNQQTFSNFLPGLAGKKGIPLWAFYVNRGQGISGFGLQNKNRPIMEFSPANKAYESVGQIGFRTFLKVNDTYYEPFKLSNQKPHEMAIDRERFIIQDNNKDLGVHTKITYYGLPTENIGRRLFSYDDGGTYMRSDSLAVYLEVLETYQDIGYHIAPNAYAYQYTNGYLETPLYNSQLKYFDDLVPLLQIVLKGYIPMYSPMLNYNSLGQEQILALIDFGVSPTYILTEQPSSRLKDTDVENFYTTEFNLWNDSIVDTYQYIDGALSHVINASIVDRDVLALGVVKVTYDNGVTIYVNYTTNDVTTDDGMIARQDYLVVGGDQS